jgi:UDP-N-acetylglucosamine transferase subunit ALG13
VTSLFATVGADGDPFDRLVGWLDRWLAAEGECVEAYLEIGASCPPGSIIWTEYLGPGERELALRAADVVVCDGSAASMTLCTSVGRTPIVVPRSARRGDAPDERQVMHCRHLAEGGRIWLAEREDRLAELLTRALDPVATRLSVS